MLRLLGIGLLQNVAGRARIPEVAAEEEAWVALKWSTGKYGEYVYLCAVRLPARKCTVPGYATIVRLTDGIGPLKPTYGM